MLDYNIVESIPRVCQAGKVSYIADHNLNDLEVLRCFYHSSEDMQLSGKNLQWSRHPELVMFFLCAIPDPGVAITTKQLDKCPNSAVRLQFIYIHSLSVSIAGRKCSLL